MKLDTSDIVVYEITKRYKIQIKINFKRRNKFILKSKIIHEIRSKEFITAKPTPVLARIRTKKDKIKAKRIIEGDDIL